MVFLKKSRITLGKDKGIIIGMAIVIEIIIITGTIITSPITFRMGHNV